MSLTSRKTLGYLALSMLFLGAVSESASARWPYRGGGNGYGARYGTFGPGVSIGVNRFYPQNYGGYQSNYPRAYGTTIYQGGYYGSPYFGNRYGSSYYGSPYNNFYGNRYNGGLAPRTYYRGF